MTKTAEPWSRRSKSGGSLRFATDRNRSKNSSFHRVQIHRRARFPICTFGKLQFLDPAKVAARQLRRLEKTPLIDRSSRRFASVACLRPQRRGAAPMMPGAGPYVSRSFAAGPSAGATTPLASTFGLMGLMSYLPAETTKTQSRGSAAPGQLEDCSGQ